MLLCGVEYHYRSWYNVWIQIVVIEKESLMLNERMRTDDDKELMPKSFAVTFALLGDLFLFTILYFGYKDLLVPNVVVLRTEITASLLGALVIGVVSLLVVDGIYCKFTKHSSFFESLHLLALVTTFNGILISIINILH